MSYDPPESLHTAVLNLVSGYRVHMHGVHGARAHASKVALASSAVEPSTGTH